MDKLNFIFRNAPVTAIESIVGSTTLAINTWYSVAVDKDSSGKIRLYVDTDMEASLTPADSSIRSVTWPLCIGVNNALSDDLTGNIDELRITKGVARYASDSGYTPATVRFPRHLVAGGGSYAITAGYLGPVISGGSGLREDASFELREDNFKELRE